MQYALSAHLNAEGKYSAALSYEGKLVDTNDDLKDLKAVRGWGRNAAQGHKERNTPADTESHSYSAAIHL